MDLYHNININNRQSSESALWMENWHNHQHAISVRPSPSSTRVDKTYKRIDPQALSSEVREKRKWKVLTIHNTIEVCLLDIRTKSPVITRLKA